MKRHCCPLFSWVVIHLSVVFLFITLKICFVFFIWFVCAVILSTRCFAKHYRGNYQLAKPYKSGPTCGDCPNDCNNKLCSKWWFSKESSLIIMSSTRQGIRMSISWEMLYVWFVLPFLNASSTFPSLPRLLQPTPVHTWTSTVTVPVWRSSGAAAVKSALGVRPPASAPIRSCDVLTSSWALTQSVWINTLSIQTCICDYYSVEMREEFQHRL